MPPKARRQASQKIPKQVLGAAKRLGAYSLSNADINAILEPDTKIWVYPDFARMSSIEEAFDSLGRCIFLFLTESRTVGHWCCMWEKGKTIHYFDSYGLAPEAARKWMSEEQLEELGQEEPYLMRLLKASGRPVVYNKVKYQREGGDVATCGRWVVTRLVFKDLSDWKFHELVRRSGVPADDFATLFTAEILGK
jgi:hypothetical protein